METIKTHSFPLKANERGDNLLEVNFYYDIGGMNYFTGKPVKRGYYLNAVPVSKSISKDGYTSVTTTAFTGCSYLLKEVNRKSKKAEKEAEEKISEVIETLVNYVCQKNSINIENSKVIQDLCVTITKWFD